MRLRLAELVAAWSRAIDLGLGLPQEHVLRQCRIALGLAERLGLDRTAVYYVAMLAWVGCTADSHELAHQFGDDLALRADAHRVDLAGLLMVGFLLRRVGTGRPPLRRAGMAEALVATGGRDAAEAMTAHCQVAAAIARRLGLGPRCRSRCCMSSLAGTGPESPAGRGGEELPLAIRLVHVAAIAEVHHRRGGVDAAIAVARDRAGGQFDPRLVEAFTDCARELLDGLAEESSWDAVNSGRAGPGQGARGRPARRRPRGGRRLRRPQVALVHRPLTRCCTARRRGRAGGGAARRCGHGAAARCARARPGADQGAEHDLGQARTADRRRARKGAAASLLHRAHARAPGGPGPPGSDRGQPPRARGRLGLSPLSAGVRLSPSARMLAAADVYHAMTEARPHREALVADEAAAELRGEVRAGRIDVDAAEDVLGAAGHPRASLRERAGPPRHGRAARSLSSYIERVILSPLRADDLSPFPTLTFGMRPDAPRSADPLTAALAASKNRHAFTTA